MRGGRIRATDEMLEGGDREHAAEPCPCVCQQHLQARGGSLGGASAPDAAGAVQEPFPCLDDIEETHLPGRAREAIAAVRAVRGDDEPRPDEVAQDLRHEPAGHPHRVGDLLLGAKRPRAVLRREEHRCPEGVPAPARQCEVHEKKPTLPLDVVSRGN